MKVSSLCTIIVGIVLSILSSASFFINIVSGFDILAIGIDIIVMILSYMTTWNGISSIMNQKVSQDIIRNEIAPLINVLEEISGRMDNIEIGVLENNLKTKYVVDHITKQDYDASKIKIIPGVSLKFMLKIFTLIIFSFSTLVFITEFPIGISHYIILSMYFVWWFVITSEFKLFNNTSSWIWGIAPVLIIPTLGIILTSIIGINYMIGALFFGMLLYVYVYYSWASYIATGFKLIDLKPVKQIMEQKPLSMRKNEK